MYDIYTVQEGDSLESIAKKFNTTPEKIYEINAKFDPIQYLKVGKEIIVPVPNVSSFEYYKVQKGDTLYNIAKQFNITVDKLAEMNGLDENDYIYDDQVIIVPKEGVNVLITKAGDTIEKITEDLGANILDLLIQNKDIYLLPNQLLTYKKLS